MGFQATGKSFWHVVLSVLAALVASGIGLPHAPALAQDAKQAFVDEKSAGTDFTLQGEYVGWVLTGSQSYRAVGLQVIAWAAEHSKRSNTLAACQELEPGAKPV